MNLPFKELRFRFIEKYSSEHSVEKVCKVMQVSRSGYYKWLAAVPGKMEAGRKKVKDRIVHLFYDSQQRYGSPKITRRLHSEGFHTSERTVTKYMRELHLRSCVVRKHRVQTTDSHQHFSIAPNILNQNFSVGQLNQVWAADITYIPCRERRL